MRASDYVTAVEVLALAVWVELALRTVPFSRLLERLQQPSPHRAIADPEYRRLLRFVAVAYDVLPFPATCLRRSVVLYGLLERRGVPSRVRFGVARNGPALAAHSWVECDGVACDEVAGRYRELRQMSSVQRRPRKNLRTSSTSSSGSSSAAK
jgi:hypothetical protein